MYDEIKESYLQFSDSFSTKAKDITIGELDQVMDAIKLDHPEIFWFGVYEQVSVKFTDGSKTSVDKKINTNKKIFLNYKYTLEEAKEIKARIEPKIQEIIEGTKRYKTTYSKVKYVHDTLIKNSTYSQYTDEEDREFQSIVSIFDTGKTVCAGYTYGFKMIMDNLGINCVNVVDVASENRADNHTWNMVKIGNKWTCLDITWDNKSGEVSYDYFLKPINEFYESHRVQKNIPGM